MQNTLIVLAGPTGVGKTDLSISLASKLQTEIISCDSRQFYKEMSIGTAMPDPAQLKKVKHHLIGQLSITDKYSSSMYERDILSLLPGLFEKHNKLILTGGSGLYIEAVTRGMDNIPDLEPGIREHYMEKYKSEGIEGLRAELSLVDPEYYKQVDLRNYKRIQRALEITSSSGKPYSSFLKKEFKKRDFKLLKIALNRDRQELYKRIDMRVEDMLAAGLENEVRGLEKHRDLNALKTVGYREFFMYFDGEISREKAIELIKRNSRHYARKQLSWFGRDKEFVWFHPDDLSGIISYINNFKSAP